MPLTNGGIANPSPHSSAAGRNLCGRTSSARITLRVVVPWRTADRSPSAPPPPRRIEPTARTARQEARTPSRSARASGEGVEDESRSGVPRCPCFPPRVDGGTAAGHCAEIILESMLDGLRGIPHELVLRRSGAPHGATSHRVTPRIVQDPPGTLRQPSLRSFARSEGWHDHSFRGRDERTVPSDRLRGGR